MELVRGKSGRVIGNLVGLLTTLKGLPSTYNKDLQEDKEPLSTRSTPWRLALPVAAGVIGTLEADAERMRAALDDDMLATDLADYLVRRGVPFRQAHGQVGRLVRRGVELRLPLRELPLAEYQAVQPELDAGVYAIFDFARSVARKDSLGGTAPQRVAEQCARWRDLLDS